MSSSNARRRRGRVDTKQVFATDGSPPSNKDVEGTPSTAISNPDPFSFRSGIKTDEELVGLRQRKKGKPLEKYHRKQNEVRSLFALTLRP
jgi:hypothetical protein